MKWISKEPQEICFNVSTCQRIETRHTLQPRVPVKWCDNIQTPTCDGISGNNGSAVPRNTEITRLNMRTWSEFASWQHLANDAPYWWIHRRGGYAPSSRYGSSCTNYSSLFHCNFARTRNHTNGTMSRRHLIERESF